MLPLRHQAAYLAAGTWHTGKGTVVRLAHMQSAHLVNALLQALAAQAGPEVVEPLAQAVADRGLEQAAYAEIERRQNRNSVR
jgi:hypothetical protein